MMLPPARRGRDPGRLLAAVLEREQREVREPGDVVLGRVDPEHAALVARPVAMIVQRHGSKHAGAAPGQLKASSGRFTANSASPPLADASRSSETASVSTPVDLELGRRRPGR